MPSTAKPDKARQKKGKRRKMLLLIIPAAVIILFVLVIAGCRVGNACKARIRTENGIQESTYVEIGGIEQYLQIRGEDSGNPVILWIHGGPGFPMTFLNHYYQRPLEKDYTVVCWEQRGCGRTHYRNESGGSTDADSADTEQLLADTDEVVDYLRERFGQEKIVIVGQSWGTVLGVNYISTHPEKVAAYIGVGQVTDFMQGKLHAAECAREKALEAGNDKDAALLEQGIKQLAAATGAEEPDISLLERLEIKPFEQTIITSLKYLKSDEEMSGLKQLFTGMTSPQMSPEDLKWFLYASSTQNIFSSQKEPVYHMYFRFDAMDFAERCSVPVCIIQGDSDWITPTDMAAEFYQAVPSQQKEMTVISGAGHTPFLDKPEEFCGAVISFLGKYVGE